MDGHCCNVVSCGNNPPVFHPCLAFLPLPPAQFKQALVGSIRALSLTARSEIRPLAQAVAHATLCPCHRTPTGPGTAACTCAVSGQPLDRRQCGRDERTVQVGGLPGGALHLAAPFNIASASGGGGGVASLSVVARIKVGQVGTNAAALCVPWPCKQCSEPNAALADPDCCDCCRPMPSTQRCSSECRCCWRRRSRGSVSRCGAE